MPGPASEHLEQLLAELAALDRRREQLAELIERVRPLAEVEGGGAEHLTLNQDHANHEGMMIPAVRVRHSQGKGRKMAASGKGPSQAVLIANAAGHSLHSLAEEIGKEEGGTYSASALTQAHAGDIGMPESRAKRIQKITRSKDYPKGIEPTVKFWPKLRIGQ